LNKVNPSYSTGGKNLYIVLTQAENREFKQLQTQVSHAYTTRKETTITNLFSPKQVEIHSIGVKNRDKIQVKRRGEGRTIKNQIKKRKCN
jgi:hypothetical protein